MRHKLTVAMMILGAAGLSAQPRPYGGYPDRYERRDPWGGSQIFDRVRSDLNRAARGGYLDGHERRHVERAFEELDRFQSNWSRGRFDNHALDKAIENIDHLANARQVNPRDRQVLYRDLRDLREFRARGGGDRWGPRGGRW